MHARLAAIAIVLATSNAIAAPKKARSPADEALAQARTEAKAGKLVAAIADADRAASLAKGKTKKQAEKLAADLRRRAPKLAIDVTPKDATVTIDGAPATSLDGVTVDPGTHEIGADSPGKRHASASVKVAVHEKKTVKLTLEDASSTTPAAPPIVASTPPPASPADAPSASPPAGDETKSPPVEASSSSSKTLGWALVAVGGAGLVAGGVFGMLAKGKNDDLVAGCANGVCPNSLQDTYSTRNRDATIATVAAVFGGAFVAAGAIVLVTSSPSGESAARLSPFVGPTSAGVAGTF